MQKNVIRHSYELRSILLLTSSLILLTSLASCKSQKDISTDKSIYLDSVAASAHHRTIATLDSLVRNIDFSFDTLKIDIERPSEYAEAPTIIRLKATNGRVIDSRKLEHNQVENYNRLDTVAYHQSAVESSAEHSVSTRLYSPPDGTVLYIVSLAAILIVGYIIYKKR